MHYVAWLISQGATPYVDIFDMNFPGTYAIHLLVLSLFGSGDGGWRAFELLWLGATLLAFYRLVAPLSPRGALLGLLIYGGYHVSSGPVQAGQRDFFLMLPLFLGSHWVATWGEGLSDQTPPQEGGAPKLGFIIPAAIAFGIALTIKPTPVLLWGVLGFLTLFWGWERGVLKALKAPVALLVIGLIPLALSLAWVASLGGLGGFFELMSTYVFPLYAKVGRTGPLGHVSPRHFAFLGLLILGGFAGVAFWGDRRPKRLWVLVIGVLYGLGHYLAQGKGWGYHLTPLGAFASALFGAAAAPFFERNPGVGKASVFGVLSLVVLGAIGAKGLRGPGGEVERRIAQLESIEGHIQGCTEGGKGVQVLETAQGGIHALLNLKQSQPTRFIYDFPFFHDAVHPVIQGFRRELVSGLELRPPGCILFMEKGWPDGGFERLDTFPELNALLQRDYSLGAEGGGYRVYEHR